MIEHHALMDLRPGKMEPIEDETLPDLGNRYNRASMDNGQVLKREQKYSGKGSELEDFFLSEQGFGSGFQISLDPDPRQAQKCADSILCYF